ncbi:MAG: hypothetical protein LBT71_02320 [Azoarcus sp.]|nr:hypothetical protein [Azoarcus sp.]
MLVSHEERTQYVIKRHRELAGHSTFSASAKLRVLLIGDSYSQDFLNMIEETGLLPDAEIRVRYVTWRCQIYIGEEDWRDFVAPKDHPLCKNVYRSDFYPSLAPLIQGADVVILAEAWVEWAARRLPDTIRKLGIPASTRIIVLGRKNFGVVARRSYLGLSWQEKVALRNRVDDSLLKINELMNTNLQETGNVEFVDLLRLVCGESVQTCPVFSPEGKLLSHDGGHLTQAGAIHISGLLKQHPVFQSFSKP